MGFIKPELALKIRLKKSKVIDLCDGEVKIRVAPLLANAAFDMSAKGDKIMDSKADLFIASCIKDSGEALFKNADEVIEFLNVVDIDDATKLLTEITAMSRALEKRAAEGNSEGTPPAKP